MCAGAEHLSPPTWRLPYKNPLVDLPQKDSRGRYSFYNVATPVVGSLKAYSPSLICSCV